jgi:hypothetical protein
LGVLGVRGRDGLVESLGKGICVSGIEAGSRNRIAYYDEDGPGVKRVNVDRKELVGADESQGDQRNLGLDGHVGAAGHHRLELARGRATTFRKEDKWETLFESGDSTVQAGDEGAGALGVYGHLARTIEIPADEGDLPERLLGEDAELKRELGKEDGSVHIAEMVGGVDSGFVLVKLLTTHDFNRGDADEEQGACPQMSDGVLLAAGLVP